MSLRLLTAIAPIMWGTMYIATTDFLPADSPILDGIIRALPAGLFLMLLFRKLPKGEWWWKSIVLGIFNIGGFFGFLFVAASTLPGGVASIVTNTAPLWVMLISPLLIQASIIPLQLVGGVVAIIGVAALVLTPEAEINMVGVICGLLASLFMAIGSILVKKWGKPDDVPQLAMTGWQLTVGGLVLIPFLAFEGLPETITATNVWAGVYVAAFGSIIGYSLWFGGLAKLPVVEVAILAILSPVVATFIGVFYKNEVLTVVQWGGLVLVLASIIVVQMAGARDSKKKRAAKAAERQKEASKA